MILHLKHFPFPPQALETLIPAIHAASKRLVPGRISIDLLDGEKEI